MGVNHVTYLGELEALAANEDPSQLYLWPRTPNTDTLQQEIIRRVGVSDFELAQEHSRPAQIVGLLRTLVVSGLINEDFTVLDLPCGDGIVLWQIKKSFPSASCYGVDCKKDVYQTHDLVQREGVTLYRGVPTASFFDRFREGI